MVDTKISDLATLTGVNVATTDEFTLVDKSDTAMAASGTNKRITATELLAFLRNNGLNRAVYNASVTNQGAGFATDTYLTGSSCLIPDGSLQAKSMYRCRFRASKTAAGTATPILNVRFGTAGTTADASRGTLTFTVGTAAIDEAVFEVLAVFRTVGAGTNAVLQTAAQVNHTLDVTGFVSNGSESETATSAGFDSTVASSIIGVSVNGGTSAAWTVQLVQAELINLL